VKSFLQLLRTIWNCGPIIRNLRDTNDRLRLELERKVQEIWCAQQAEQDSARMYKELRAQLMQVRVSQSTIKRAGWEVMCFIPEEALDVAKHPGMLRYQELLRRVAEQLVILALDGVHRVLANGTCCALVFEPLDLNQPARAPRFVQALWDQGGEFKLSEKCWDQRTEEQRVKQAAGGFGV
jgi:hypothetical protein